MGVSNFVVFFLYILGLMYYPYFSAQANWPSGLFTGTDDTDTTTAPTALTAPTSEGDFEDPRRVLGCPGGVFGSVLAVLGAFWGPVGRSRGRFGGVLGCLGAFSSSRRI